jgi:arsenate reductase (thioredoxin)
VANSSSSARKRYLDWDLADPRGLPIDDVRALRDQIGVRIDALVAELVRVSPSGQLDKE